MGYKCCIHQVQPVFQNRKHKKHFTLAEEKKSSERFMLPFADVVYVDYDFIFQQNLLVLWSWWYCPWLDSKLAFPQSYIEYMSYYLNFSETEFLFYVISAFFKTTNWVSFTQSSKHWEGGEISLGFLHHCCDLQWCVGVLDVGRLNVLFFLLFRVYNITDFRQNKINTFDFSPVLGRYVTVIPPENKPMVVCDINITGMEMGMLNFFSNNVTHITWWGYQKYENSFKITILMHIPPLLQMDYTFELK